MNTIPSIDLKDATVAIGFFTLADDYLAKIVKVVDGDTVNAVLDLPGFGLCKFKVRLYGINTPELRPPKIDPKRDEIIIKAKEAKKVLSSKVLNQIVTLKCYGWGKYGRLLAEIIVGDENINEWLVKNGYGERYII